MLPEGRGKRAVAEVFDAVYRKCVWRGALVCTLGAGRVGAVNAVTSKGHGLCSESTRRYGHAVCVCVCVCCVCRTAARICRAPWRPWNPASARHCHPLPRLCHPIPTVLIPRTPPRPLPPSHPPHCR